VLVEPTPEPVEPQGVTLVPPLQEKAYNLDGTPQNSDLLAPAPVPSALPLPAADSAVPGDSTLAEPEAELAP
jgi:hypothetical protein